MADAWILQYRKLWRQQWHNGDVATAVADLPTKIYHGGPEWDWHTFLSGSCNVNIALSLVTNKQTNKQINKQNIAIYGCPCKVLSFFLLLESPTPPYWWWGAICIGKAIFTSKLWLCSTQTILRERKFWIFWIAKVNLVACWFYIPSRLPKSS